MQDGGHTSDMKWWLMNYSCSLCGSELIDSKDRYLVTGRSSFDIVEAIENWPFDIRYNSESYVCRKCLSLLKKKRNLEHSYDKCLKELQNLVNKPSGNPEPLYTSTPVKKAQTPTTQQLPVETNTSDPPRSQTTATVCL
jgi:DNA-directed RNA polymerase subunit RPC12/RpoP